MRVNTPGVPPERVMARVTVFPAVKGRYVRAPQPLGASAKTATGATTPDWLYMPVVFASNVVGLIAN